MIKEVLDWIEVNNIEEKQHKKIAQSKWEWVHYTYTPVRARILALYKEGVGGMKGQSDYLIDYVYSLLET
jgi:hypothetical protein